MANKYENDKQLLIIHMSWREFVAARDEFGQCYCCGEANFDEGGYYVAIVDDWYCKTCFDAYYSGAKRTKGDLEKERMNYNKMRNRLRDLGCFND